MISASLHGQPGTILWRSRFTQNFSQNFLSSCICRIIVWPTRFSIVARILDTPSHVTMSRILDLSPFSTSSAELQPEPKILEARSVAPLISMPELTTNTCIHMRIRSRAIHRFSSFRRSHNNTRKTGVIKLLS